MQSVDQIRDRARCCASVHGGCGRYKVWSSLHVDTPPSAQLHSLLVSSHSLINTTRTSLPTYFRPCHRSLELPCACAPLSIGSLFLASTKSRVLPPCRYIIFPTSRSIRVRKLTAIGSRSSLPRLFGARRYCLGHPWQMLPTVRHACQLDRQSMSSMCYSGRFLSLTDLLTSTRTNNALSLHSGLV